MRKTRFSEEQIINILKGVEAGQRVADACRTHGISEQTYHRWKAKYGGLDVNEARRLKSLEDENRRLKSAVADLTLDNRMLKDMLSKKWCRPPLGARRPSTFDRLIRCQRGAPGGCSA
jgi:putative transposase